MFHQSEWQRICGPAIGAVDETERMARFRTSLALDRALVSTCNAVFDFEEFPVRLRLVETYYVVPACAHNALG